MKSVQVPNFFWSVFSRIQSKYREIRTRKNSVFEHFSRSDSEVKKKTIRYCYPNSIVCLRHNIKRISAQKLTKQEASARN